ncbi:DUF4875 domain-containing protein [Halalkalibacter okhensis]|uniref:DUF4875 domain-containing protein n=1 Tax=Halalkalibacter okhensis TaxID=333138 RepID=A0A0B0IBQ2_9BACI|nr:hypothetical protein [Halalkalibacter okhensis]KHF39998.1 hypothetical protein LQ50_11960 [Halalkalibacter okhensis]
MNRKKKMMYRSFLLISLLLVWTCAEATATTTTEKEMAEENQQGVPSYTIVEEEDLSNGNTIRFAYWVVPSNIYIGKEAIEAIVMDVVEEAKEGKEFNAVVVWVIDDERQVGKGYTLAKFEYAPKGDWTKAADVVAGDYSTHEFVFDFGSATGKKLPKDYEQGEYPTAEELDVYFYWTTLVYNEGMDDEEAVIRTAEKFGITQEEADEIIMKVNYR